MIRRKARLTVLVPLVVFATVSGLFAVLWSVVEARDASEAGRRADLTTEQIATRLLEQVSFRVNLLEKIRYDWRRGHIESAKTFGEHAESALYGTVALSSITWIDESGIMRWTAPEMRNSTAIGQSVFAHVIAGPILREALETGQWRLTPMLDLTTRRRGMVVYVPIGAAGENRGAISATLDVTALVDSCLEEGVRENFDCSVWDAGNLIFGPVTTTVVPPQARFREVGVGSRTWRVVLTPRSDLAAGTAAADTLPIMVAGLLVAAGLAFVSARLLASQALLRENEERLRAVAEHIPGVIYSYESAPGAPRSLIYLGPGLGHIIGPKSAARVEADFDLLFELLHPEDRAAVKSAADRGVREGGTVDCEARLRTDDGAWRWVRSLSRPLHIDKDRTRWHIVLIDITEHRRTVDALRESEDRYRRLVESSPIGVLIHRKDVFQFANPAAVRLLGYDRAEEIIGRSVYDLVPAEQRETVRQRIARLDGLSKPIRYADERLLRRDGTELNVEIIANTIQFAGGAARQILFLDMTEQRQAEQRQQLLMRELDHRVKNNLASVLALLDQTAASTRDIGEFRSKFAARVKAMARTHEMLARAKWSGVDLADLTRLSIAPYIVDQSHRVSLSGCPVTVRPRPALPVALAFHELATNALKHGSLATPEGRIAVTWARVGARVSIEWSETDGPPAPPPEHFGTGLRLVRGLIEFELGGTVNFRFAPPGLTCTISLDAAALTGDSH